MTKSVDSLFSSMLPPQHLCRYCPGMTDRTAGPRPSSWQKVHSFGKNHLWKLISMKDRTANPDCKRLFLMTSPLISLISLALPQRTGRKKVRRERMLWKWYLTREYHAGIPVSQWRIRSERREGHQKGREGPQQTTALFVWSSFFKFYLPPSWGLNPRPCIYQVSTLS